MYRDPSAALLGVIVVLALSLAILTILGRRHGIVFIALLAFVLRAVRGVQVQIVGDTSDGAAYDEFARGLVRFWQDQGTDPGAWVGKDGFPALLGAVYTAVGHAPEVGYLINALAGGLTVLVVAATTYQMGWHSALRPAAWLVALWPVAVIWGGMLLREAIVTLLLAVGAWGMVRLYNHAYGSGATAIILAGFAMVFMRGGLAFLVLIGMPMTALLVNSLKRAGGPTRWIVAVATLALVTVALNLLSGFFGDVKYFEYRTEVLSDLNRGSSSFGQAGLGGAAVGTGIVAHAIRVPLTAIGPLPWQVTNLSLALAAIDALLWIAVWAFAIYGTRRLTRRAESLLFFFPMIALVVALAAIAVNFGLIIRLRGQGIPLIAPLAAFGWVAWREARAARRTARAAALTGSRSRVPADAATVVDSQVPGSATRSTRSSISHGPP